MAETQKTKITFFQKATLVIVSVILTVGLSLLAGNFIQYGESTVTEILVRRTWDWRIRKFGSPEIGIYEKDENLGWRPIPGSSGEHYQPYSFDVAYHIDEEGHRVTPGNYDKDKVLFLGGSFSFGHGVEDDENFIYQLGEKIPSVKMINGTAMGWGTAQSWLYMQESLEKYNDIKIVIYGFIMHHLNRNHLRKDWLELVESWGRQNPYFEFENNKPISKGFASAKKMGVAGDDACLAFEKEKTLLFIQNMQTYCNERGVRFVLVYIPDGSEGDFKDKIAEIVPSENYIDLRNMVNYQSVRLRGDAHLSPEGHRQIAELIAPKLKSWLANPIKMIFEE